MKGFGTLRFLSWTFVFLISFSLVSCGGSKKATVSSSKPDWVDGESSKYSRGAFITGVGIGDTRTDAENQARVKLSEVFMIEIHSKVTQDITYSGKTSSTSEDYSLDKNFSNKVTLTTDQMLEGVQVVELWKDPTSRYYALAVLKKLDAVARLKDRIDTLDQKLTKLMEMAKSLEEGTQEEVSDSFYEEFAEEDLTEEISYAAPVSEGIKEKVNLDRLRLFLIMNPLAKERDLYAKQLSVLSTNPDFYIDKTKDYTDIEITLNKLLSTVQIAVSVQGEGSRKIRDAIVKSLGDAHFKVNDRAFDSADITLRANVESKVLRYPDKTWKWAQSEVTIDLVDNHSQKVFGTISKARKEGSKDLRRARDISLQKISDELEVEVNQALLGYLQKG